MTILLAALLISVSLLFAQEAPSALNSMPDDCAGLIERASKETLPPRDADRLWFCRQPRQSQSKPHEGWTARQPPSGDVMRGPSVTPWILAPDVKG